MYEHKKSSISRYNGYQAHCCSNTMALTTQCIHQFTYNVNVTEYRTIGVGSICRNVFLWVITRCNQCNAQLASSNAIFLRSTSHTPGVVHINGQGSVRVCLVCNWVL